MADLNTIDGLINYARQRGVHAWQSERGVLLDLRPWGWTLTICWSVGELRLALQVG